MAITMSAALTVGASYPTSPDFDAGFDGADFISLRSISGDFIFSFDGKLDHGMVFHADVEQPQVLNIRARKVWLKQNGGAATARVAAWERG